MIQGSIWRLAVLGAALLVGLAGATGAAERADPPAVSTAHLPVASDARLGGDEKRTRFIVDVSKNLNVTAFTLADPTGW